MEERQLACSDCGASFPFTVEEQEFFASKGFQEPRRCKDCRAARKQDRGGRGGGGRGGDRPMFEAVCAACGITTTVPFQPKDGRPVYCRDCFRAQSSSQY